MSVWKIIQYYYCRQRFIPWLAGLGALLTVLKFWAITFSEKLSFSLFIFSLTFIFLIPFMSSCTTLREIISNHRLALIPGLKRAAGIAQLSIVVVASFWWSLNGWLFAGDPFSIPAALRSFSAFTLVAGIMQLILPSRFFVQIVSFLPVVIVLLVIQIREPLGALLLNNSFTWALFLISLTAWAYGLTLLNQRNLFAPVSPPPNGIDYWSPDAGMMQQNIGGSDSASGTLLLGYPDGWKNITFRVMNFMVITPIFITVLFYIVGFGQDFEFSLSQSLFGIFLLLSMCSACACISMFGEMAARCRLIWLRQGSSRQAQWQIIEQLSWKIIYTYLFVAGTVTTLGFIFSSFPKLITLHYFLAVACFCIFNMYLSLAIKVFNWSTFIQAIIVTIIVAIMVVGLMVSITQNNYALLTALEACYLLSAFLIRQFTKTRFLGIDWFQIKFTQSKKALTG